MHFEYPTKAENEHLSKHIAASTKHKHTPSLSIQNMTALLNHVFVLNHCHPHQLLTRMVTRMDPCWLLASTNHRLSFRVWYVNFTCLPYVALLSLGSLPRVALLPILFHHMHDTLGSSSNHSTYFICLSAHDERYEILLAFPLPTTQHYY